MTRFHFELRNAICTLVRIDSVNPRWATQLLIFGQIDTPTFTLHCSSPIVGGHEKQNNSNTTAMSSSASGVSVDWDCALPLQSDSVHTQYIGVIEEQKQTIRRLQEEGAEFNCIQLERCQQMQAGERMFYEH
jgi:hypothetical protein